jgi:hypothetical protein
MYQPGSFHAQHWLTKHPPYGLFLDPHHGQHNWTAASSRALLCLVTLLASFLIIVALGPH